VEIARGPISKSRTAATIVVRFALFLLCAAAPERASGSSSAAVRNLAGRYREVLSGINLGRWAVNQAVRSGWRTFFERFSRKQPSSDCGSAPWNRWIGATNLLGLMASSPRIAKHVHAPAAIGFR